MIDVSQYTIDAAVERASGDWHEALPPHVSHSQLQTFDKCEYLYQQERVLGRKGRTGEKLFTGSALHLGIENVTRLALTGQTLGVAEAVAQFQGYWWPQALDAEREKSGEIVWDDDSNEERAHHRAALMLGTYLRDVFPRLKPVAVEEKFSYPIEGMPVPIDGRIDIRQPYSVIDLKTSTKRKTYLDPSWRMQGAVYNAVTGLPVEFHTIAGTVKTNTISVVTPLESEELLLRPTVGEQREYMRTIRAVVGSIADRMDRYGLDEPWPTSGVFHPYACKDCPLRSSCPAWEST